MRRAAPLLLLALAALGAPGCGDDPTYPTDAPEPTERELAVPPPPRGTKIRINEFAPGYLNEAGLQEFDGNGYYIRDGIVIVPKHGVLQDDAVV